MNSSSPNQGLASEVDYPPLSSSPPGDLQLSQASNVSVSIRSHSTRSSATASFSSNSSRESSTSSFPGRDESAVTPNNSAFLLHDLLSAATFAPPKRKPSPVYTPSDRSNQSFEEIIYPRLRTSSTIRQPVSFTRTSHSPNASNGSRPHDHSASSSSSALSSDTRSFFFSSGTSTPQEGIGSPSRQTQSSPPLPFPATPAQTRGKRRRSDSPSVYNKQSDREWTHSTPKGAYMREDSFQSPHKSQLAEYMLGLARTHSVATTLSRTTSVTSFVHEEINSEGSCSSCLDEVDSLSAPSSTAGKARQWRKICSFKSRKPSNLFTFDPSEAQDSEDHRATKRLRLSGISTNADAPMHDLAAPSVPIIATATIRRAQSLRTEPGPDRVNVHTHEPHGYDRPGPDELPLPNGVPIIAPPQDHRAQLPLSRANVAKKWIYRFLERERARRVSTTLDLVGTSKARLPSKAAWAKHFEMSDGIRETIVRWFLEVLPSDQTNLKAISRQSSFSSHFSSIGGSDVNEGPRDLFNELSCSPQTRFHAAWMFLEYFYILGQEAAAASEHDQSLNPTFRSSIDSLFSSSTTSSRPALRKGSSRASDGEMGLWDIATACLALSVKYHHDILPPFYPVYSDELEALAPFEMLYEDLEEFQRTILQYFNHELGSTPQTLLDAIWIALPDLAAILGCQTSPYDDDTNHVEGSAFGKARDTQWGNLLWKETWGRLLGCLFESDVLQFSLSTLTCVALTESLLHTLTAKYESDERWDNSSLLVVHAVKGKYGRKKCLALDGIFRDRWRRLGNRLSQGVRADIQTLCGVKDDEFRRCATWMRTNFEE